MSVQLIAWALEQRTGSVSRKAVLLCLANRANSDTGMCCPSIKTIMAETELGRMTVFRALEDLESAGLIERIERTRENGGRTSNTYRFPPVTVIRGEYHDDTGDGLTVIRQEPELRTRTRTGPLTAAAAPPSNGNGSTDRPRNETWDALAAIFGEPTTRSAQKIRGKVCASLRSARASPSEIETRAKRWPLHFDTATLTDLALEKHWDTLGRKPLRRT